MEYRVVKIWKNGPLTFLPGQVVAEGDLPPKILAKMQEDGAIESVQPQPPTPPSEEP